MPVILIGPTDAAAARASGPQHPAANGAAPACFKKLLRVTGTHPSTALGAARLGRLPK
jgi:hypothetical protein